MNTSSSEGAGAYFVLVITFIPVMIDSPTFKLATRFMYSSVAVSSKIACLRVTSSCLCGWIENRLKVVIVISRSWWAR